MNILPVEASLLNMIKKETAWLKTEHKRAEDYLRAEKVDHLGVGDHPAFHVWPYLALWAVQSKSNPGWVGWWVITGDLPCDYISSSEGRHPRVALRAFARHWSEASGCMLKGEAHPTCRIGTPEQWPELGELLRARAKILQRYADDDELWKEPAH